MPSRSRNRERWENPVSSSKLIAHDAREGLLGAGGGNLVVFQIKTPTSTSTSTIIPS